MTNKRKEGAAKKEDPVEFETGTGGKFEELPGELPSSGELPDPEEIKLPPLKKKEPQRTVADEEKPKDSNTADDKGDHASWDYRRNK
jgi:hypothetical protein